jgi:hypothetical protein
MHILQVTLHSKHLLNFVNHGNLQEKSALVDGDERPLDIVIEQSLLRVVNLSIISRVQILIALYYT